MTKEDYVSFETAKLLKEKGFNYTVHQYYKENGEVCNNPKSVASWRVESWRPCATLQMAMKWLREEKRTSIIIEFDLTKRGYCPYVYQLDYDMDWVVKWRINTPMKYEEAVEAAIKYCLENLI